MRSSALSKKEKDMRKVLLATAVTLSLAYPGLLFAGEADEIEFLNSGKVLPTNLPSLRRFAPETRSICPVRSASCPEA